MVSQLTVEFSLLLLCFFFFFFFFFDLFLFFFFSLLSPLSASSSPPVLHKPPPPHHHTHHSYIKWTQSTFKSGNPRSRLLPLLERATRALGPSCPDEGLREKYRGDVRYLRVWVQYVSGWICFSSFYAEKERKRESDTREKRMAALTHTRFRNPPPRK